MLAPGGLVGPVSPGGIAFLGESATLRRALASVAKSWTVECAGIFLRQRNGITPFRPLVLLEVPNVEQQPGEPRRRWFFSHEQDLFVWFGEDGTPVAFQLSYGKYRNEHSIRWKAGRGFTHHRVDDGESSAVSRNAPLLMADGVFDAPRVFKRFRELSAEMPREIADFVAARLQEHPEWQE